MFNGTPKKLIIVGDKDTDVYCEYLSMLISVVDDVSEVWKNGGCVGYRR